ncbi:MAG: M48 family metallopeptidase [Sediminispirochaetaceae bacterium]
MNKKRNVKTEFLSLKSAEADLPITLTRRAGQKHIRIRVSLDGKISLSAPIHTPLKEVKKVLSQKEEWILSKLRETSSGILQFDPLSRVYLCGRPYEVNITPGQGPSSSLTADHRRRSVNLTGSSADRGALEALIAGWLRREAKKILIPLAQEVSRDLRTPYKRIFLRNQRTRWGSSSSIGNISLNWRTVMLPHEVQRYLIIHELAHQHQLNHSRDFWNIVEKYCPRYREYENVLKINRALMGLFRGQ